MSNMSPEMTREFVTARIEYLKGLPTFGEPTAEDYIMSRRQQEFARSQLHTTDRGKRLVSVDLGVVMDDFEAMFKGKSVLDVGCGTGVLANELAKLKKTKITALDHDPEILDKIRPDRNVTPVLGSGFDIAGAVGDEKFDVIVACFSSYSWAETEAEKRASIMSPLGSCVTGGKVLIIPALAEPGAREENRQIIKAELARVGEKTLPETLAELREVEASTRVADWLDVIGIETLFVEEEQERIDCTFLPSRDNMKKIALGPGVYLERYSAIVEVLPE